MINILRDIVGVSDTNTLTIPFQLYDLPEEPMNIELIIFKRTRSNQMTTNRYIYRILENGDEESVTEIGPEDEGRAFIVKINTSSLNVDQLFIRIYNKDISFITSNIYVLDNQNLFLMTAEQKFKKRPKKIKIVDVVDSTYNNAIVPFDRSYFDIEILVCNNYTSTKPVWEDMTEAYLNKELFTFDNKIKDADKDWTIAVKYNINKITKNSTVELSDIKLVIV